MAGKLGTIHAVFNATEMCKNFTLKFFFQKNPSTIRVPEEDVASESHIMDHVVFLDANVTEGTINQLCKDAGKVLFSGTNTKLLLLGMWCKVQVCSCHKLMTYFLNLISEQYGLYMQKN